MTRGFASLVLLLLFTESCVSQRRGGRLGADVSQTVEFDCPEEFGYYPHPSDCTQYYVCVFGGALLESCTGGLMYSHELQTCDWPRNVGCGLEGESATVSTIRVTDSRTRQGPATGQSPSRASVLSARAQSEQQKRQEDELAKHRLYAEDVGPAEEIESDRQQRVYRGQPSTVGQVARDRDGLRHQPVTNALPTSTGRVGSEDKIGVISFGIPQQAANSQYSYDELTQDDNMLTKETISTGSREKRQVQLRLPSQAPVLQLVRSGINLFFPPPTPITRPTGDVPHNSSINTNFARNGNQLTGNWNFQPTGNTATQRFPPPNLNFLPRSLNADLQPPDILASNTDYSALNYQTSQNVNNVPHVHIIGSFDRQKLQPPPQEHFGPFSSALTNLVKAFSSNIQNPRPVRPSPENSQFEGSNITQNHPAIFPSPSNYVQSPKPISSGQFFQTYTEPTPKRTVSHGHSWSLIQNSGSSELSPIGWETNYRGIGVFTPSGYNPNDPLFYSDFNNRERSKLPSGRNEGIQYFSNIYQQASRTLPTHSTDVSLSTVGHNRESSSVPQAKTTESNFKPNNNAFGSDADGAENKNIIHKPIVYVETAMPYQVEEIPTTILTPEVAPTVESLGKDDYWSNNANTYQENSQGPVQSRDEGYINQRYRKPRRRRLRKPKHRRYKTTQFNDGIETEAYQGLSPGQEAYIRAPEQFRQAVTAGESEYSPLYQTGNYYNQKDSRNNDDVSGSPAAYFDSQENHKDVENPFARFDFDFEKFLEKLRGGVKKNKVSTELKPENILSNSSEDTTENDEPQEDEVATHESLPNNEDQQKIRESNVQDDASNSPLVTESEYVTHVPETVSGQDIIYYGKQKNEGLEDDTPKISTTAKQTNSNGGIPRRSNINGEWLTNSGVTDGNLSEQTTSRPYRSRKKNKPNRKPQVDNFSSLVAGNERIPSHYESQTSNEGENIENYEPQNLNDEKNIEPNNFHTVASLSPRPRDRLPNKKKVHNRYNTVQLSTSSSLEQQGTNEAITRVNNLHHYTTQVSHIEQPTKHNPPVLSYSEPFVTTQRSVTGISQNLIKKSKFYDYAESTLSQPITQSMPQQGYEEAHHLSYTTRAAPLEQLTQYTLPRPTKATPHESLESYSTEGLDNKYKLSPKVYFHINNEDYYAPLSTKNVSLPTVKKNVYSAEPNFHESLGTTGLKKYPIGTVSNDNYFNTTDNVEMVRDVYHPIDDTGTTNGSKKKLMKNNHDSFEHSAHNANKNPLFYNTYESTRTLDHSTTYIPIQEHEKNIFLVRDEVTKPSVSQLTYTKPPRLPIPTKHKTAYVDDTHIPIPTYINHFKIKHDNIFYEVPPTISYRHNNRELEKNIPSNKEIETNISNNREIDTNIPTYDDDSFTTLMPATFYLLNKGPTSKQPTSVTVTSTSSVDVDGHGDFEQTGRAGQLDQQSTSNTTPSPAADQGVMMTQTQRVEPSSAPAVYSQQVQNQQQPLSPAQNQVAYNSTRQEYNQAQYDPYYNLYDEEDVELYRDVDYSQYSSNTGPASNAQYQGQNYKQVLVPQREQKSPSYAQPTYSNQDVYGQTVAAQDYDKNYNTPADDQYQQNVAVQQPVKTSTRKVMRQRERGGPTQQTTQSVDSSHFDKLWTPALLSTQTQKPDRKQTQTAESRGITNKNVYEYSTKPSTTELSQTRRQTPSSKDLELQTQRSVKLDTNKSPKDVPHRSAPASYSTPDPAPKSIQANQIPPRSRGIQPHHPTTESSSTNFKSYEISGNIREQARKKENSFAISQGVNSNANPVVRSNTGAENSLSEPSIPSSYDVSSVQHPENSSNFPTYQRHAHISSDTDDSRNRHVPSPVTERILTKNIDRTAKSSTTSRQPLRQTTEKLSSDMHSELRTNTLVGHPSSKDRKDEIDSTSQSAPKGVDTDPSSSLSRNSIIQTDSTTLRSRGRGHSQQRKQQTSSCSESFDNNVNVDCKDKPQVRVRPVTAPSDTQSTPSPARGSTTSRTRGSASYTTAGASGGVETVNRGTPASVRSRPTLKPSTAIVSKASEFIDVYKYPPTRPEPVYPTPQPDKTAAKCRKDVCLLPDCYCGGKDIPGALAAEEVPQIVLLTFDDAVNDLNKGLYSDLFEKGRKNPNGCPISATYYVSHEWTDYSQVQNLYADGHEMASHSVSHSFGEKFSQKKWTKEIAGQREILAAYGGVRMEDIRGMRAPFLAVGGNKMFKMLYDSNFTYDSSMPVYENKPPSWPYTLDYKLFHDCMIPPCPTRSYPGVWEVPMVMWQDLNGGRCSMGDACSTPATADGIYKMLIKNFERHYTTNRAPFGLFYHASWFTQPHHKEAFIAFMDTIVAMQDVWLVTNWQAIQWVRDPTPLSRINSFQPFQCNYPERPKKCNNPKVCNLWHKSGVRYMRTCQPCPDIYPWTGKTGVRNSRVDNEIVEES